MLSKTGRFRRADRILRNQDFKRVLKAGKRRVSEHFVVVMARQADLGTNKPATSRLQSTRRLGVTVSKRVGNSVVRNRVKRRIREWFRRARVELPEGSDWVVIARVGARNLSGTEAAMQLDRAIRPPRAGSVLRAAVGIE